MGRDSKIEWCQSTWNCIRGCTRISSGCQKCYAERIAARFSGKGLAYEGLAEMTKEGPRWTGKLMLAKNHLKDPLRWNKPRLVFVNSMSDLFHEDMPELWIDCVFVVMLLAKQHIFQVLTKRAGVMKEYIDGDRRSLGGLERAADALSLRKEFEQRMVEIDHQWPPNNIWLGVSAEDQKTADERIPALLATSCGGPRWVSAEPLLGPLDLTKYLTREHANIKWVVAGGESGHDARACDAEWLRSVVNQCRARDVPVFVKQMGAKPYQSPIEGGGTGFSYSLKSRKGGDMNEWPIDLRVRMMPGARKTQESR